MQIDSAFKMKIFFVEADLESVRRKKCYMNTKIVDVQDEWMIADTSELIN